MRSRRASPPESRLRAVAGRGAGHVGLLARLSRPLAADDSRAHFWVGHVRVGVVLTEVTAVVVIAYALLAARPQQVALVAMAIASMVGSPALLALPVSRIVRDPRGSLLFYAWSTVTTAIIAMAAQVDGGAGSPLVLMLFLTLTFAGLAYPPLGVALMGAVMVLAYLALVAVAPPPAALASLTTSVLVLFCVMAWWASRNQWDTYDQQQLLAQRLAMLADTDALTGCLNRGALQARLDDLAAGASLELPLSVLLLDLDGFKHVNDSQGHAAGDFVLVEVARAVRNAIRETDSLGRLGGDEFAVLLPGTPPAAAGGAADRVRAAVRAAGGATGVTASIGVASTTAPLTAGALLEIADRAMYQAKTGGRDCVSQPARPLG